MNSVNSIFLALALIFGGGYALNKIYVVVKRAAIERIQRGQPSLERFTNRMTGFRLSKDGDLVALKKRHPDVETPRR